ncbi:hypothetical protein [Nostoc sp. DedQUE03]
MLNLHGVKAIASPLSGLSFWHNSSNSRANAIVAQPIPPTNLSSLYHFEF